MIASFTRRTESVKIHISIVVVVNPQEALRRNMFDVQPCCGGHVLESSVALVSIKSDVIAESECDIRLAVIVVVRGSTTFRASHPAEAGSFRNILKFSCAVVSIQCRAAIAPGL